MVRTGKLLKRNGGADRDRTDDLLNAIQALSQLSYSPKITTNFKSQITNSKPIL